MTAHKRVWPQVYKAALFELDTNKVSGRIAEAETALVQLSISDANRV